MTLVLPDLPNVVDPLPPVTFDAAGYGNPERVQWVTNARNGGSTYDPEGWGYPYRIVLHAIQGSANPAMIAGHAYPPQLWYNPITRALYQTIPLSRGGFALWQDPAAPHYTNRARALQVEIHGYSEEAAEWPIEWLDNITHDVIIPLCRWVAAQGAMIDLLAAPPPGAIPMSARADAPQRLTPTAWALCSTLVSHRHVPMGDDHWDTGGLDTPRIAQHAALVIGGLIDSTPGRSTGRDQDVAIIVQVQAPGDPLHESLWACNGLFKRRITRPGEVDEMLATGMAVKQPNGAAWVSWPVDKIASMTTIDEWSIAGMPSAVAQVVGRAPDANQVAGAVMQQLVPLLPQTSPQFAAQIASAVVAQIPAADPHLAEKIGSHVAAGIHDAIAALPSQIAEAFTEAFVASRRVNPPADTAQLAPPPPPPPAPRPADGAQAAGEPSPDERQ